MSGIIAPHVPGGNSPAPIYLLRATAFANGFVRPPPKPDGFGPILCDRDQREYFKGCVLIGPENRIIGPRGISYRPEAFNSTYGGKLFVIDNNGRTTSKPWDAATNNPLWTIPKVDGTRFLPGRPEGEISTDALMRKYINTYVPATIETLPNGDVTPFLRHLELLLPVKSDRDIIISYLAHNAKYPGHKIAWAPLIQSVQGAGKNVFKQIMRHVISPGYFYEPKAKQLNEGGSKFNAWMDCRLFFLVDEVKTDDRRDMVETLKPFISETQLEIEGKGTNQKMGDTPGNWLFFSNHKNAIPITRNDRRFSVFYSAIQSTDNLRERAMDDAYFRRLYDWLGDDQNGGHKFGLRIIADWLLNHPIGRGAIDARAPRTSSYEDALAESRGWLEQLIIEAVEGEQQGFRGGWISTAALGRVLRENQRNATTQTLSKALAELGYSRIGQARRGFLQDDASNANKRGSLWNLSPTANLDDYGRAQGYDPDLGAPIPGMPAPRQ